MNKTRRLRWAGYVARMEKGRSAFKILTGTSSEKKPLGSPRRKWQDNITMDLNEICINTRNSVDLTQGKDYWKALVNAGLNLRAPKAERS